MEHEGRRDLADVLGRTLMNKGVSLLFGKDDARAALDIFAKATAVPERLVNEEGRTELSQDLAVMYLNWSTALGKVGDSGGALAMAVRAIEIRERLVYQEGRSELAADLEAVREILRRVAG